MGNRAPVYRTNTGMALRETLIAGKAPGVPPRFAGDSRPGLIRLTPPLKAVTETLRMIGHTDMKRRTAVRAAMEPPVALFADRKAQLTGKAA